MANWNLSVDLRGNGNDLAQSLKASAKHARTLGTAARTAKTEIRELGAAAQTATRHIRTLGTTAQTAGRRLNSLGDGAQSTHRQLTRYGDAARTANRNINTLGDNSRTTGRQLASMSGQINTAVRDLLRLADAAQRASTRVRAIGPDGARGLRQMTSESGRLRGQLVGLAALLSGGGLVMGFSDLVKHGNEYQQSMNTFGAVTSATRMQMQRAAATASQLGNDLSLPGATASDAAEAMVELAKAGFRTDQAIGATRASLTLASAAQVNAADSAKYLGDMMDQFGMGADQASVAADTLAATANAASGDIIDIYYAMKYAGPVAHGLGVTMQEAASAVGMLGKAGILGQTAGTTLRGMMANLAAPTPQMIEGLKAMNIEAWDAQGNFKGLRYVIEGLSKAQHNMTNQDFAAAVKKSMGKPAMSGAIALAHQGVDSFDALMEAVSSTGAAAQIATAKGKGLAGAMLQLKTQARQTGLAIYDGMAPGLEYLTRGITVGLSKATPSIEHFFQYLNDSATLFGPDVADAARSTFSDIGDAAGDMMAPFKELGGEAAASALHALLSVGRMAIDVLENLAEGVEPVVSALGDMAGEGDGVADTLDIVVYALDATASAISSLSGILGPIGHLVGGLVHEFSSLPGPVQSAVLAMLLMRRVGPIAQSTAGSIGGRLTGAYRSLNEQMAVQRTLAASSGASISRYGAAFAVLQTRVPVIGAMGNSFRTAATQAGGFTGALRGVTAAAGTGLRSAMSGLMGVMGGPWGIALAAATVGLGILASRQQKAAAAAAEHQQQISSLSQALRESNGEVDANVRAIATENLMSQKIKTRLDGEQRLVDIARKAKVPMSQLVDAYTNQGTSLKELQKQLAATADAQTILIADPETGISSEGFNAQGQAADDLRESLHGLGGDFEKAAADAKSFNEGVNGAGSTTAYDRLKDAVSALADKTADADSRTRALRDALDLLSGGSVSLQAAQARVNQAITQANEAMAAGVEKADGWGKALVGANGALDTTTKNGQQLFSTLDTIADSSSSAAVAAYDFAQAQGKDVPQSVAAATKEMKDAREAAIKLIKSYDVGTEEAGKIADAMGLIPGRVGILLQTEGVDTALAELMGVQAEFERLPKAKTIKVDALGAEAKAELEKIGYQIDLIPGTREYKITAPTAGARRELDLLVTKLGQTNGKTLVIKAPTGKAKAELQSIQDKVRATKGKTLSIKAPTDEARLNLERLGFKIKDTKGKTVTISVPTGNATYNARIIQNAIDNIHGKQVGIGVYMSATSSDHDANGVPDMIQAARAQGGIVRRAQGGPVQYYPTGGAVEGPGTGTSDSIPALISNGEYVIKAASVQKYGVAMFDRLNAGRFASGGAAGFTYTPTEMASLGTSDARGRFDNLVGKLRDAWSEYNTAVKELRDLKNDKDSTKAQRAAAQRKVSAEYADVRKYDAALGLKAGAKAPTTLNLNAYQKQLNASVTATTKWQKNLAKIGARGGQDIQSLLQDMGEEGYSLVNLLAGASTKQFKDITAKLLKVGQTAKATLADFTTQINAATKTSTAFQANLATLAGQGYGDLATQLAGQGDAAAETLAAEAVKNKGRAATANSAAKASAKTLSAEELEELVAIIAAVKTSKTGLHAVADTTGLGEDEILSIANKANAQIKGSLGTRATQFLADLARANKGLSYANGGIREGIYSTRAGAVTFAEPSTGGEAFIPLGPNKRAAATNVLRDVAGRFGVGLTDMSATRPVYIVQGGGDTHVQVTAVRTGATASDIGAQVGRSVRRARRGGVNARVAA